MEVIGDKQRRCEEAGESGRESSAEALLSGETRLYQKHFPGVLRKYAYRFDGSGNYSEKDWDLEEGQGSEFCWYHVELPKGDQKLSKNAQYLIDVLCPPLKLHEILALVSNGPYCGQVERALVFRVNSPGPSASDFTLRFAVRVTRGSVITVSLGRIPRMGFSRFRIPLLKDVPMVGGGGGAAASSFAGRDQANGVGTVIDEHLLEFLLRMDHSEEADNPVPATVSNLVVHIIDTYVDHVHDIITNLEMELDAVELELDKGDHPKTLCCCLGPSASGGARRSSSIPPESPCSSKHGILHPAAAAGTSSLHVLPRASSSGC